MHRLVWRVKLVADFGDEAVETDVEVARIERDEFAIPETLGLSLEHVLKKVRSGLLVKNMFNQEIIGRVRVWLIRTRSRRK